MPTPEPAKQAEALAAARGDEGVEHAHAEVEGLGDAGAGQRVRRVAGDLRAADPDQGATAVDGPAEAVEHPAQQARSDGGR